MRGRPLLLLGSVALLSGCSNLTIQVDVLDRTYAEQAVAEAKLRTLNYEISRRGSEGLGLAMITLNRELIGYLTKLADLYDAKSKEPGVSPADQQNFADAAADLRESIKSTEGTIATRLDSAIKSLEAQTQAALALARERQWAGTDPVPADVRQGLYAIQATRDGFAIAVLKEKNVYEAAAGKMQTGAKAAAANAASAAVDKQARTMLAGPTLAGSEYAFVVSKAPDEHWSTNFNRAVGTAQMGNSDIVIKLNSQADFSVKGMRFDASTVAAVASKVTTQALLLGIQMAGVPLPRPAAGAANTGDGAKLADASGQLAADQEKLAKRKAKIDAWRVAMREMALTILAEEPNLSATNWPQQKDIVATHLDAMFDAMRSTLELEGLD